MGASMEPKYVQNPIKNYVQYTQADTNKAEKILGFKAKLDLSSGIDRLLEYYH
jgi:nucleoside-diphosphate-sugar epimerase